jgi:hypothetical protein
MYISIPDKQYGLAETRFWAEKCKRSMKNMFQMALLNLVKICVILYHKKDLLLK